MVSHINKFFKPKFFLIRKVKTVPQVLILDNQVYHEQEVSPHKQFWLEEPEGTPLGEWVRLCAFSQHVWMLFPSLILPAPF